MNPRLLFWAGWWTSGDLDDAAGLGKKRFAKWERPDEDGTISNLMPGEQRPDVEQMEREGWVFSEMSDDLEATDDSEEGVVVEFIE